MAPPVAFPARVLRRSLWLLGALIVVLLVIGIALDVRSGGSAETVHSPSEQAQVDAEARYRSLASDARAVATSDPELSARLGDLAADLEAQADAVALPRVPGGSGQPHSPSPTAAPFTSGEPGDAVPTAPPPAAPDVLELLRASTLTSMLAAVDADPGPRRVLASAGANQWQHTALLAEALGVEPPLPPAGIFPAVDLFTGTGIFSGAVAVGPTTGSAGDAGSQSSAPADPTHPDDAGRIAEECTDTPRGPEADRRALHAVRLAEEEARYAYEVAAARLPGQRGLLERSAVHAGAAEQAARSLAALCVPVAPSSPGFALGADLREEPWVTLPRLEQEHVVLYAGVVGSVSRDLRGWAIAAFTAAVQRSIAAGAPVEALPGLPATEAPSPRATSPDAPSPDSASPDSAPADDAPENARTGSGTADG